MKLAFGLSAASWACFLISAVSIKTPSPLLLATVPGHFVLGLAAFFPAGADRRLLAANAALLCVNYFWLYRVVFLGG